MRVTQKLQEAGHTSYLVGGCVRDLLCGLEPKDFDISTLARPRQVKRLIRNSFIIGKRFRLVLVRRGEDVYEVSTFRRNPTPGEQQDEMLEGDNLFGSPEQDAFRRDYSCNALFYDPKTKQVIDYTGGLKDLEQGWLKMIGEPEERLTEDPIRILRALRFCSKLHLQIEPQLLEAIELKAEELKFSPLPRKREEFLKIFRLKNINKSLHLFYDLGVYKSSLPSLGKFIKTDEQFRRLVKNFSYFDKDSKRTFEPSELFGIFMWSLAQAQDPFIPKEELLDWCQKEEVNHFLKFELGAFNNEITHIEQSFRILPQLRDFESFKRKGESKKINILSQKSFPFALILAAHDPTENFHHEWIEAYEKHHPHFQN